MAGPGNANSPYIAKRAATLVTSGTTAVAFVTSQDATKTASVYFPVTNQSSLRCVVRAWGRTTTGTSGSFLAKIQFGTNTTAISNTDMASLSAQTVATNGNWEIQSELVWDSTSKKLRGRMTGINGDTPTLLAVAVNTAAISTVDLSTSSNGLTVAVVFGTGNAGNTAFLDGFTLEVL